MKGIVVLALREMVIGKFGKDKWEAALQKAGVKKGDLIILATSDVDDSIVLKVVNSLCKVLNITLIQAADAFGDYWINVYTQKTYPAYYRRGKTAKEFLLELDKIHVELTAGIPNAHPPRFEYEWKDEKTLIMKYKSHRGLIDFVAGMIKGVGKFYKEDLKVSKLGNDKVEIVFSQSYNATSPNRG
ncbi:MAG: hypothetical protein OHK0032_16410 [Thermodesulfovibrionales bacterium]